MTKNKRMATLEENKRKLFWSRVDKDHPSGCWLWTAGGSRYGYGTMSMMIGDRYATLLCHRISYSLYFGEIPDGMFVCHKCDVRKCVNPDHLFLGTNYDNVQDMVRKGRMNKNIVRRRGEGHHNSKLKDAQVLEMRRLYNSGMSIKEISVSLGVHSDNVGLVVRRKSWVHL